MPPPIKRAKPAMLVVDDEQSVALTLSLIFRKEGFLVSTAGNCAEALALLGKRSFDVVVTDLHMEKPDIGLVVAQTASQLRPRPVVIILTGYASMNNTREAMRLHVDYYAFKPVVIEDLLENLRRLIGRRVGAAASD